VNDKVSPAQVEAMGKWGVQRKGSYDYLKTIKQPTLVVNGSNDHRWPRDAGLRLDHLLLSPAVASRLKAAGVDRDVRGEPEASDHAPSWVELKSPKRGGVTRKRRSAACARVTSRSGSRRQGPTPQNGWSARDVSPSLLAPNAHDLLDRGPLLHSPKMGRNIRREIDLHLRRPSLHIEKSGVRNGERVAGDELVTC
jgi:hypothetical protein